MADSLPRIAQTTRTVSRRCLTLVTSLLAVAVLAFFEAQAADAGPDSAKWRALNRTLDLRFPGVANLSTTELATWLSDRVRPPPLLVDVREAAEYAVSHLPGAVWAGTEKAQAELLKNTAPERPLVFYCSVGWRSAQATQRAQKSGRAAAFNLRGSIFQWANEGRPLVGRRDEPTTLVHPYDNTWGQLLDRPRWSREPLP